MGLKQQLAKKGPIISSPTTSDKVFLGLTNVKGFNGESDSRAFKHCV